MLSNDIKQVDEVRNEMLKNDQISFLELLSDSNVTHDAVQSESKPTENNESDNCSSINETSVVMGDLNKQASEANINDSIEGDQMLGDLGEFSELNLNELITDLNDGEVLFDNYFTNADNENNNKEMPKDETSSIS